MLRWSLALCGSVFVLAGSGAAQNLKAIGRELRSALRAMDARPAGGARAVAAIEQLAEIDSQASTKALLAAARQVEKRMAPIGEKRRKGLLAEGGSGRLKRSRYELRNLEDAADAIGVALQKQRSQESVQMMLRAVVERSSTLPLWLRLQLAGRVAELSTDALPWRTPSASQQAARRQPDNATTLALLAATAALGRRAGELGSGAWVRAQLKHDSLDVRLAAIDALAKMAWPGGIESLIGCLEREGMAEVAAAREALQVLTSQHPGDAAESWRAWLKNEGAPYLRGDVALSQGKPQSKPAKAKGKGQPETVAGSFFGLEPTGVSILYVIDNSQSMKSKLGKRPRPGAPVTGAPPVSRWDLCRRELAASLRALTPTQKFNVVSFANKARSFAPAVVPATAGNIERAIAWVDALKLEFQTNVYDALDLGFLLAGRGTSDRYYASEVDTMFFLSDGAPTIPKLGQAGITGDDCDRILRAVRRWNALGRVRIHAIGLGLAARGKQRNPKGKLWATWFLQLLAEQNGGRYKVVRK